MRTRTRVERWVLIILLRGITSMMVEEPGIRPWATHLQVIMSHYFWLIYGVELYMRLEEDKE